MRHREADIDLLQDFQNIFVTTLSLNRVVGSMTIAFLCGLFIANIYRVTFKETSYSTSYVQSLVSFAMITTIVIMVIGNNLARAFGLVGSMSIIRFRMSIKDTKDILFIFFTLAIGMACGVGLYMIAAVGTIFISIVILVLSGINFASPHKKDFLLNFYYESQNDEEAPYLSLIAEMCKKHRLVNIKSIGDSDIVELSYAVTLKKSEEVHELIRKLNMVEGITNINFFFDETE